MKPLFDKVVIMREKVNTGSIITPEGYDKRNAPARGEVIAVGPNTEQVEVGDKVIFGQHAGSWIEDNNEDYFICLDVDILAIINEEE